MMGRLRTPFLIIAAIAAVLALLTEMGGGLSGTGDILSQLGGAWDSMRGGFEVDKSQYEVSGFKGLESLLRTDPGDVPGYAIPALTLLDYLLVFTLALMTLPLVVNMRVMGVCQGPATIVVAILVLIFSFITLLTAIVKLIIMITMLLALPFGTILYMILFADFDTSKSAIIITTAFYLKCACGICLILAHEQFLKNTGFWILLATTIVAGIITSVLHNFPPTFIVSITDAIAAIVSAVLSLVWCVVLLIGGIIAVVKTILGAKQVVMD